MRNKMNAQNWITVTASCLLTAAATVAAAADEPAPKTGAPAQRYSVRPVHPRIFLDKESLHQIASRCARGKVMEPSYKALVQWVDANPLDPKSPYFPRNYCDLKIAFAYLIEKELGRDGSRFLRHIREVLWKKDGAGIDGLQFGWDAIMYDWLYNDLTPDERLLYGNRIGRFLRNYTNVPEITLVGGTYWYNQTWGGAMGISWCRDGIAPKTMVALAIAGEKTDYKDDARRWLDSFAKRMPDEFVKKFDQLGGVWPEGPAHGGVSFAPFITWEAWRSATGENLFPRVARTGFHRESPYWNVYGTVPHTGHMAHIEDTGPGMFRPLDVSMFRALHAARYRDGVTGGMAKSAVDKGRASCGDMIWYDASVPLVKKEALPLAFHFRGSGHVYMRSAWQDADDAWAVFTAAPVFTTYGSGQGGTGTFQIAKQGLLVGHAGYQHNTSALVSQNVVLVYDPREKYFAKSGAEVKWNDGGPQIPNFYHSLEPVPRGEIVAYEHCDAYTYVAADLTRAYSSVRDNPATKKRTRSEKIREVTRQFVYVRGNPEFFVIYDRVCATDAALPKTWVIHLQDEPEVLADGGRLKVVKEGRGFKSYQGAQGLLSRVVSRDGKCWTTAKRGAVGIRTLLPKGARITKRGGKGFEVWGNPHDPKALNMTETEPEYNDSDIDVCLWRMEVDPPDRSAEQHFLHVVIPYGDAGGKESKTFSPQPRAFKLVEDASHEGVSLNTAGGSWTVRFNRQGPLGGTVSVRRGAAPAFNASLANEVRANPTPSGLAVSPNK